MGEAIATTISLNKGGHAYFFTFHGVHSWCQLHEWLDYTDEWGGLTAWDMRVAAEMVRKAWRPIPPAGYD